MTELDDRLRYLFDQCHLELGNASLGAESAAILERYARSVKQAFTGAGYIRTLKLNGRTIVMNGKDNIGWVVYYPDKVMNGQEFYERFEAEYYNLTPETPITDAETKALWAAKRAAGLTDD